MNGLLTLEGMMQFQKVGAKGWGVLEYLGGKIFIDPQECGPFNGSGMIKKVELGVTLSSGGEGTGIRVQKVLGVVYAGK